VAWATLRHLPADLLAIGCAEARETCDHPAKIVPAIVAGTKALIARRRAAQRGADPELPALEPPDRCTPEQARAILDEFGLASGFAGNRNSQREEGVSHGTRG
jgi:hypothetical protein